MKIWLRGTLEHYLANFYKRFNVATCAAFLTPGDTARYANLQVFWISTRVCGL